MNVLVISFSHVLRDARVKRQVALMTEKARVHVINFDSLDSLGVQSTIVKIRHKNTIQACYAAVLLKLRLFDRYYWNKSNVLQVKDFNACAYDVIVANDVETLPLALKLAEGRAKVIVDAHEYTPEEFSDNFKWRFFYKAYNHWLCKKYLPLADHVVTVGQFIAVLYERNYHIKPVVVYNAPRYYSCKIKPVDKHEIKMVHHGIAIRSRHLERMIELFDFLDERYTLDFMMVANDEIYFEELKRKAQCYSRIRFIDPVLPEHIVPTLHAAYDIGLFILPPVNTNYKNAMPNKLFEFVQARLAVAIGPSAEMMRVVNDYRLGIVAPNFSPESMAYCLNQLTNEEIFRWKQNAAKAAQDLSYENSSKVLASMMVVA